MKQVHDPRLLEGPKIWRKEDSVCLSFKVNTPLRVSFIHYNLMQPAALLWRAGCMILVIDLILWFFGVWSLFFRVAVQRETVYLVMLVGFLLWNVERMTLYSFTRLVFGKRIRLKITREKIVVGRWPYKEEYDRSYGITFSIKRFEGAQEMAYRSANGFYLIIDDRARVKLTEIFDPLEAPRIVASCNMALILTDEMETYEMDPTAHSV